MPIDCSASFVDATEACNGRVLICLKDSDTQGPYFKGFDINGGTATGSTFSATGFQSSINAPPYTQDFNVTDEPGFQCFFVPYNTGSQSSDVFVIQSTDGTSADACELAFTVKTSTECAAIGNDGEDTDTDVGDTPPPVAVYTCNNAQLQATAGEAFCVTRADLGVPDDTAAVRCIVTNIRFTPAVTFVTSDPDCVARIPAAKITTSNFPLVMTFDVLCNDVAQAIDCQATITITSAGCPDPKIVECQNGQVALLQGVAKTLNVSGCECCSDSEITWRSPNPELTFNPVNGSSTQVTASASGNFTIEVECCKT